MDVGELPIKFFDRDILEGKATLIGDEFRANFMNRTPWFRVQERHGETIMAVIILHKR